MSITVSDMVGDITALVYNPLKATSLAAAAVEKMFNGDVVLVDANNPFILALELQAVSTCAFLTEAQALTRALYPAAATTFSDLYRHLSDTDYLNMFALPSRVKFKLMLEKNQVLEALVEDQATGVSQLTIPRNTVFNASGTPFSLQYPINIRQLQHGGLQVVYDATVVSPLQTLDTNVIDLKSMRTADGVEYFVFEVEAQQFFINSSTTSVSATSGLTTNIQITDQFYYCRVYRQVAGAWVEMVTTYTEQVYDANTPTAVLKVADGVVTVVVPPVYTIGGAVRGKLRIDVYETKGPLNTYYGNLQLNDFTAKWLYLDSADASPETSAINKITNLAIYSDDTTIGGRDALTFDEARARVIENAVGPRKVPITTAQASVTLVDEGYTVSTNVDSVTNRRFIASRALPTPAEIFPTIENDVYTPANAHILTALIKISDAVNLNGCIPHDLGMTVTSAALFTTTNSQSSLLTQTAYAALMSLTAEARAEAINNNSYFYTPFHYVLEASNVDFTARPYAMDWPSIDNRKFVMENATTGFQVSIGTTYSIEKTSTGYRLTVSTSSSDAYKALNDAQVQCQLRVTCPDGGFAYLTASPEARADQAEERYFIFNITTNFEIDRDHTLDLTNFLRDGDSTPRTTALTDTLDVFFTTSAPMPPTYSSNPIDSLMGATYLHANSVGLTYEQVGAHFGDYLANLWVDFRTYADSIEYQTWAVDVPDVYTEDVYEVDPLTGAAWTIVNGALVWNKLHSAGTQKLDAQNHPLYKYRAGDFKVDENGNPLPMIGYDARLLRSVSFYVIDAAYRFASDSITSNYIAAAYIKLLSQLTDDLPSINKSTLEQTVIYYHPVISDGEVEAYIGKDALVTLPSAQSFTAQIYVPTETYSNATLLASLSSSTIRLIGEHLATHTTVSIDDLETICRKAGGDDMVSIKIAGLGGGNNYRVVTMKNNAARLSVKKTLVVKVNDLLSLEEDIQISFIVFDPA